MNKILVVYYSRNGNNKFLAEKVAARLNCDLARIRPRLNFFPLFLMKAGLGIWPIQKNIKSYDLIILCGPVWVGSFVVPLRDFIKKYGRDIKKLNFITCCGSSDAKREEKFGHGKVFHIVKEILGEKCTHCEAFPVGLVLPDDKKEDGEAIMQTRLSEENFKGEIEERFGKFIEWVKSNHASQ